MLCFLSCTINVSTKVLGKPSDLILLSDQIALWLYLRSDQGSGQLSQVMPGLIGQE